MLNQRHIQNLSEATNLTHHWGYADRAVPCTNDPGSCAYLDVVYNSHDIGMLYVGVMWIVILGIVFLLAISRHFAPTTLSTTIATFTRQWFLSDYRPLRFLFGRTTRLQVIVLAISAAYLLIFSFAGIKYATWITPVKNTQGVYNTRTSLGPWADRAGVLAYALTPLSILLANRESLLSVLTGIPYHHFNFLHRWLGHIIFAQAALHTIGWCVVEIRLYQPQPQEARAWIVQPYIIWGVVAMFLLLLLWGLSTSYARRAFGYEFFRKAHYVLAMIYIGACWAHWAKLQCFLLPALLFWGLDRGIRLVRTALIHYRIFGSGKGIFETIPATITYFDSDVVRLDFDTPTPVSWDIGQHFYICFADTPRGIWQSHPFTPLSLPGARHSYVLRAKLGETKRLAALETTTTPVILTGPYGGNLLESLTPATNILCIAGGTGITFVLPVLLHLARTGYTTGKIELIWVIRHHSCAEWVAGELEQLRQNDRVGVTIHATGSTQVSGEVTPVEEGKAIFEQGTAGRPDLKVRVSKFVHGSTEGPTCVYVSGPPSMIGDVRDQVALCNDPKKVWRGDKKGEVRLVYDERLE